MDVELISQPCGSSLDLAAGCGTESNCPLLSSVTEVSASVQEESCPPLPGKDVAMLLIKLRQLEFPFLIGGRLGFLTIFVGKKCQKKNMVFFSMKCNRKGSMLIL